MISYEYPLSERVRTLLRFEDLYERIEYFLAKSDAVEHHAALVSIFEILEVASRADLKSDLLQELERQKQTLESLRENPMYRRLHSTIYCGKSIKRHRSCSRRPAKWGRNCVKTTG